MSIRKEDLDLENPLNNLKLFWNAGKENWKKKEHIARLTVFYSKYHPSKLDSITSLLSKYEGRELEMYNNIVKKYGADALSPAERKKLENTHILTEYYKIHNPEKVSDVPKLISKYSDDYDHLFAKMQKKYGIDPRDEIPIEKVEIHAPEEQVAPKAEEVSEEYSDYSYSEEETKPRMLSSPRKDDGTNLFSSLLKSSKKLLNELSAGGKPSEKTSPAKSSVKADIGGALIDRDVALQSELGQRLTRTIQSEMEHVDNTLNELAGVMKTENDLWQVLAEEASKDSSSAISGYSARLGSLLERVKAIEIMLMNREEELQRRDLEAWKSQKEMKFGKLQDFYTMQVEEKRQKMKEMSDQPTNTAPKTTPAASVEQTSKPTEFSD
ncbi:hypothetical protein WA538_004098, partial [Blastocystis sp. DL]